MKNSTRSILSSHLWVSSRTTRPRSHCTNTLFTLYKQTPWTNIITFVFSSRYRVTHFMRCWSRSSGKKTQIINSGGFLQVLTQFALGGTLTGLFREGARNLLHLDWGKIIISSCIFLIHICSSFLPFESVSFLVIILVHMFPSSYLVFFLSFLEYYFFANLFKL